MTLETLESWGRVKGLITSSSNLNLKWNQSSTIQTINPAFSRIQKQWFPPLNGISAALDMY